MNEIDPTQFNDENLETEFFPLGELQKHFEENYAPRLGNVAISGAEVENDA